LPKDVIVAGIINIDTDEHPSKQEYQSNLTSKSKANSIARK
jgi:hypothetical protein